MEYLSLFICISLTAQNLMFCWIKTDFTYIHKTRMKNVLMNTLEYRREWLGRIEWSRPTDNICDISCQIRLHWAWPHQGGLHQLQQHHQPKYKILLSLYRGAAVSSISWRKRKSMIWSYRSMLRPTEPNYNVAMVLQLGKSLPYQWHCRWNESSSRYP